MKFLYLLAMYQYVHFLVICIKKFNWILEELLQLIFLNKVRLEK